MERNLPSSSNISVIKEMRRPERVHLICQSRTFWKYTTTTFILLFSNNALWEIFRSEITIAEYFIGRSEVVESYQVTEQNLTVFIKSLLRNDPAFFYSDPVHCLSEFWATAQDSFPAKIRGTTDEGQVGWQSIDEEDLILIIFSSSLANSPNIENYEQPELHYFSQYVRIYVSYQVIYVMDNCDIFCLDRELQQHAAFWRQGGLWSLHKQGGKWEEIREAERHSATEQGSEWDTRGLTLRCYSRQLFDKVKGKKSLYKGVFRSTVSGYGCLELILLFFMA